MTAATDRPKVYLDTCCLIDLLEARGLRRPLVAGSEPWLIDRLLQAGRNSEISVFTSLLTNVECTHLKDERGQRIITEDLKAQIDGLLWSGRSGLTPVQSTVFILEAARDLYWKHGLSFGPLDSVHVATAIDRKCREFLTGDGKIAKATETLNTAFGLAVRRPGDTQLLPLHYRQHDIPPDLFSDAEAEKTS